MPFIVVPKAQKDFYYYMADSFKYDDSQLQAMWSELTEKERKKSLRGAMRNLGNTVKKQAISQFRSSSFKRGPFDYHTQMDKGFRVQVMTKALGFTVTIKPTEGNQRKK